MKRIELTDREISVIRYALYRFAMAAHNNAEAAAQDGAHRFYKEGDLVRFVQDARDADALRAKITAIDLTPADPDHHVPEWLRREVERGNRAGGVG